MPRAAARKRRAVRSLRSRGGAAGKRRRSRTPQRRVARAGSRRRRASRRLPRVMGGPSSFHRDLARVMFPHDGEHPCRWPDGGGQKTVAMNVVTTGVYRNPGNIRWHTGYSATTVSGVTTVQYSQYGPKNCGCFYVTPGSILYPLHFQNKPQTSAGNTQTTWRTQSWGFPSLSTLYTTTNEAQAAGTIISTDFGQYRVTGASFKMTYIGNSDDSAGELIVSKFQPRNNEWTAVPETATADFEEAVPLTADNSNFEKRTERFPSRVGFYTGFCRGDSARFGEYKNVVEGATQWSPSKLHLDSPAICSMEAIAVFVQGTKTDPSTETDLSQMAASASLGAWRWELIQTVEFIPKLKSLTNRIATDGPPDMPMFRQTYDHLQKMIEDRGLEIVPANKSLELRQLALAGSIPASRKAAAASGHNPPRGSVDPVGMSK